MDDESIRTQIDEAAMRFLHDRCKGTPAPEKNNAYYRRVDAGVEEIAQSSVPVVPLGRTLIDSIVRDAQNSNLTQTLSSLNEGLSIPIPADRPDTLDEAARRLDTLEVLANRLVGELDLLKTVDRICYNYHLNVDVHQGLSNQVLNDSGRKPIRLSATDIPIAAVQEMSSAAPSHRLPDASRSCMVQKNDAAGTMKVFLGGVLDNTPPGKVITTIKAMVFSDSNLRTYSNRINVVQDEENNYTITGIPPEYLSSGFTSALHLYLVDNLTRESSHTVSVPLQTGLAQAQQR